MHGPAQGSSRESLGGEGAPRTSPYVPNKTSYESPRMPPNKGWRNFLRRSISTRRARIRGTVDFSEAKPDCSATSFQQITRNTTYFGCLTRFYATQRLLSFRNHWGTGVDGGSAVREGSSLTCRSESLVAECPVDLQSTRQTSAKPPGLSRP